MWRRPAESQGKVPRSGGRALVALCASGVVFDRRLNDQTHVFGNTSALYQNDLVIVDQETGSYWFQTGGEAVIGPPGGQV